MSTDPHQQPDVAAQPGADGGAWVGPSDSPGATAAEEPRTLKPARVLAVFAHPDDETLSAGGLLAQLARTAEVYLVTTNRGERGEVIPGDIAHLEGDPEGLAALRTAELAEALAALGVQHHAFFDQLPEHRGPARYTDSGMRWGASPAVRALPDPTAGPEAFSRANAETAARVLAAYIRRIAPQLVITDEPDGGYGHPDHVHASRVTARAVELAAVAADVPAAEMASTERPAADVRAAGLPVADVPAADMAAAEGPAVGWVVRPESVARAATRWLQQTPERPQLSAIGRGLQVLDPDAPMPTIVVPDDQVDATVNTADVSERVLAATRAHRSQVQEAALAQNLPSEANQAGVDRSAQHRPEPPDPAQHRPEQVIGWFGLSNDVLQPIYDRAWLQAAPSTTPAHLRLVLDTIARAEPAASGSAAAGYGGQHAAAGYGGQHAAAGYGGQHRAGHTWPHASQTTVSQGAYPSSAVEEVPRWYLIAMSVFTVVMGVIFAAAGTAFHRWTPPWGIILAIVAVTAGGLLARTFADRRGSLGYAIAAGITVFVTTWYRPGGDVLVTDQPIGYIWIFGCLIAGFIGMAAPKGWFHDEP